jgi:pimeloyl-ACP methyl ester carboxylesterase
VAVLEVAYFEASPGDDDVFLLHGFPYGIHSSAEVTLRLAMAGYRVIAPYLPSTGQPG